MFVISNRTYFSRIALVLIKGNRRTALGSQKIYFDNNFENLA